MTELPADYAYVREYAARLREADCQATVVRFRAAMDNHEPVPRREVYGYGVRYVRADGQRGVTLWRTDFGPVASKRAHKALFLIDDGRTIEPHYVAGYGPDSDPETLFVHPFPTNFNGDGSPRMREGDPSRRVDYSAWMVGPAIAYHLKIS